MAEKLNTGERFPNLTLKLVDGTAIEVPAALGGKYNILLFYRGHW